MGQLWLRKVPGYSAWHLLSSPVLLRLKSILICMARDIAGSSRVSRLEPRAPDIRVLLKALERDMRQLLQRDESCYTRGTCTHNNDVQGSLGWVVKGMSAVYRR